MNIAKTTGKYSIRQELEHLLSEGIEHARERTNSEFDRVSDGARDIVLFGAGGLGRKILKGIRLKGLEPVAISDNNPTIWGSYIDGIPVLAPLEAAARFGCSAVFVVSIWRAGGRHRFDNIANQLRSLGCAKVVPFITLMWKYHDYFLPYYCIDRPEVLFLDADRILAAFELWEDEISCREYLMQVSFRLFGDISGLSSPVTGEHYFPADILNPSAKEIFADCGAFDGDVLRSLFQLCPDFKGRIHAFEPAPSCYQMLCDYVKGLSEDLKERISVSPLGIGSERATLRFSPENAGGSAVDPNGPMLIDIVSLDEYFEDKNAPTFIKMDIEGAEPEALAGATAIVSANRPVLGISSYHKPDHLWAIPLQIASMTDGYTFFLRPHNEEGWDLVTYAISRKRNLINSLSMNPGGGRV
jgi:FkbM family methyltransferase